MCPKCAYNEELSVDVRNCADDEAVRLKVESESQIKCPNCDHEFMEHVWLKAPAVGTSADPKSDANLKRLQQSLRERFIKRELDDVRHKHGKLYDDSIRSAAAQRIKKGEKPV